MPLKWCYLYSGWIFPLQFNSFRKLLTGIVNPNLVDSEDSPPQIEILTRKYRLDPESGAQSLKFNFQVMQNLLVQVPCEHHQEQPSDFPKARPWVRSTNKVIFNPALSTCKTFTLMSHWRGPQRTYFPTSSNASGPPTPHRIINSISLLLEEGEGIWMVSKVHSKKAGEIPIVYIKLTCWGNLLLTASSAGRELDCKLQVSKLQNQKISVYHFKFKAGKCQLFSCSEATRILKKSEYVRKPFVLWGF